MTRAAPRIKASPALPTADDPMALCSGKVESILNAGLKPPQEDQAKKSGSEKGVKRRILNF
jgi:hypothetical protein